jgi:ABC-type branched-subunit amino acid transport system substrate-binding protein
LVGCALVGVLVVGTACSSRDDDDAADTTAPAAPVPATTGAAPVTTVTPPTSASSGVTVVDGATTVPDATTALPPTTAPAGPMFGTMPSPCGPGEATIAEGQNGDDGVLRLAAANDHDNQFVPGLTQELLDSSIAFAKWCNEQGGIKGLKIEIIDMDGHITESAAAMENGCDKAFAMVGGGMVLDDQEFPRFNECGMIDFAGYAVTATKALSSGMVQPVPNPPNSRATQWLQWAAEEYPDAVKNTAIVFTDIATTAIVAEQLEAAMEATGGWKVTTRIPVALGEANWAPFAQQIKDRKVGAMSLVGEATTLALLLKAMDEVNYRPEVILEEANHYDKALIERAGKSAEGVMVRTMYAPFEEADQFPGLQSYFDVMEQYNPNGKQAGLGLQSMSAHLMFATAANACIEANDGVLERECVLAEGRKIESWDGGGLHAETHPNSGTAPECGVIMQVIDGRWQRRYPELGSADDNAGGWNCREGSAKEIPGVYGDYEKGVDPDRPS